MTDKEKLKAMRQLGVVWRRGHLPVYRSMSNVESHKADKLYDSMSDGFVDHMCSRVDKR